MDRKKSKNVKREMKCKIMNRRAEILGHVIRKANVEHLVTTGQIVGGDTDVDKEVKSLMV